LIFAVHFTLQMKRILTFTLAFSIVGQASAQTALEDVVAAEKSFAQLSVDKSIRTAFLAYFDDNSMAFVKGEPVPGRKGWEEREENNAYLFWWPVWADVASSGDFGFTTGPAVFGGERQNPKPTGGVYYASVWKKNEQGNWKVAADLGTGIYDPAENKKDFGSPKYVLVPSHTALDAVSDSNPLNELFAFDQTYIARLNNKQNSFDPKFLSMEARIHRPGHKPATNDIEVKSLDEKGKFAFSQTGGSIAESGDMGATWGRVKVQIVRDGKESTVPLCYMRVWKKEHGKWKIVLDVIG
jgi:ketosteroid isomerase-like protein